MCSLLPVARIVEPSSVPKNQYIRRIIAPTTTRPIISEECVVVSVPPDKFLSADIRVFCPIRGVFAFPIMRIFIEYIAICVRMLARRIFMRSLVFIKPVASPVSAPIIKTKANVSAGFIP